MNIAISFNYWRHLLFAATLCCMLSSCSNITEEFLDMQQNPSIVIPKMIRDYQALLDNATSNAEANPQMNQASSHRLSTAAGEEYTISDQVYNGLSLLFFPEKNAYSWAKEIYGVNYNTSVDDWYLAYKRILYANLVIDGIQRISPNPNEMQAWNNVMGSALFFRALNFYNLAQQFCKHYDAKTAKTDLGIVLRLTYDVTAESKRASVEETYLQILRDLETAVSLLPPLPENNFRPSQVAAYALLMRTQLTMGNPEKVVEAASAALAIHGTLIDFNDVDLSTNITFPVDFQGNAANNPEIFFYSTGSATTAGQTRANMSQVLLDSYEVGDLRAAAFFRRHATNGNMIFKGSYSGSLAGGVFTGFAADEVWITRAEAYARLGHTAQAIADLNHLLRHRYDRLLFEEVNAMDADQALTLVLQHRRKELVLRGTRWTDLRRLNTDPRFSQTLVRTINGVLHELPPGDNRWVWPIPLDEIDLSKIEQNPR